MFYREALYTGFNRIKERKLISISDIIKIQSVLVQSEQGFRTLPGTELVNGIEQTSRETIEKVRRIKTLLDETVERVKEELPKIYSKELVETLFENPYCKVEFIQKAVGVERKAASRYLHQLEQIGVLDCVKMKQTNIFINTKLLDVLKG